MKKLNKKGISLIVLVITIIVMIILATAIILTLSSDNIIGKAKEGVSSYNSAQKKHMQELNNAESMLAQDDEGTASYYAAKGELQIGDYVEYNYTAGTYTTTQVDDDGVSQSFDSATGKNAVISNDKWRVLNIDNGVVQLIPDIRVVPKLTMYGAKAYLNAEKVLNDMCEALYSGQYGTARSIEIEDIDKKVGYNGTKWYNKNNVFTKVEGITTLGELENQTGLKIKDEYRKTPDGSNLSNNLKVDYYSYATLKRPEDPEYQKEQTISKFFAIGNAGWSTVSSVNEPAALWEMISYYTDKSVYDLNNAVFYWLANVVEDICLNENQENSYIKYGVRIIDNTRCNRAHVWNAKEGAQDGGNDKRSYGVVPVVTLKAGLQVQKTGQSAGYLGTGTYNVWSIK